MADILPRKFYRITGLHNVFAANNNIYDTSKLSLASQYTTTVNEHTILFLTADAADEGKYISVNSVDGIEDLCLYENMTMIWARGAIYAVEQKTVKNVNYSKNDLAFTIVYTDGTTKSIVTSALGFTAGDNIDIDDNNVISAIGYFFDNDNNFITNPESNSANGQTNALITGTFSNTGDKNAAFLIGCGTSLTSKDNAFSVSKSGTVTTKTDFIATANGANYKLSDIHSVQDSDWAYIG